MLYEPLSAICSTSREIGMLKLFQISMIGTILVALPACQAPKQIDSGISSTTPTASHEPTAPDKAAAPATSPPAGAVDTTPLSADDAAAYQAGLVAYEDGASLDDLGQHQSALGKFRQAAKLFEKVAEANPGDFKARVNWGSALSRLGQPAEAVIKFQQALALAPGNVNRAEALYNWGTALERLGRHREAIEKFEQAIALKADLLTPTLQDYLQRHRERPPDAEIQTPAAGSPTPQ
jgi:tetratricopeptide (TPR) repeat protein